MEGSREGPCSLRPREKRFRMVSGSEHNDQTVISESSPMTKSVPMGVSLFLLATQAEGGSTAKRNRDVRKDAGFHKADDSEVGELLKSHAKSAKREKKKKKK